MSFVIIFWIQIFFRGKVIQILGFCYQFLKMLIILQKQLALLPCGDLLLCLSGLKFVSLVYFSKYNESSKLS